MDLKKKAKNPPKPAKKFCTEGSINPIYKPLKREEVDLDDYVELSKKFFLFFFTNPKKNSVSSYRCIRKQQ